MAKRLTVVVPHTLGTAEAMQAVQAQKPHVERSFGKAGRLDELNWAGNSASYSARALGFKVHGTMNVGSDRLTVTIDLPWMLTPFGKIVETSIKRSSAELFSHWEKVRRKRAEKRRVR